MVNVVGNAGFGLHLPFSTFDQLGLSGSLNYVYSQCLPFRFLSFGKELLWVAFVGWSVVGKKCGKFPTM